jgi:hypothetical protein
MLYLYEIIHKLKLNILMGLMSFLKGVGSKLFPSTEKAPEVKAAALLAHV